MIRQTNQRLSGITMHLAGSTAKALRRALSAAILSVIALLIAHAPALAERRVALVIGNSGYQNTAALANPKNDADDIAAALRALGFEVIHETNLDKRGMENALRKLESTARGADSAFFFYAGHGMQFQGVNYLMPVDAKLEDELSPRYEMTRLDDVRLALESAKVRILVLDACRNNPLADRLVRMITSGTRTAGQVRGFTAPERTGGMLIAYATQANDVASDGTGRNSPFTRAMLNQIKVPGLEVGLFFRRVAQEVSIATKGKQLPEVSLSLLQEFYLNRGESDVQVWARVRNTRDQVVLRDFIDRYPSSFLVPDATALLDRIEGDARGIAEREATQRRERDLRETLARLQQEREKTAAEPAARERVAREEAARVERERASQEIPKQPLPQVAVVTPSPEIARTNVPPNPALVRDIKTELQRLGCYSGEIDGDWKSNTTKRAVESVTRLASIPVSATQPDQDFLNQLRGYKNRICPLVCNAREREDEGRCVLKTCASGQVLDERGNCVARPAARAAPVAKNRERDRTAAPARRSKCFTFAGTQHCE